MAAKSFIISTTRLENFSDGVFAIILTLLAFQFKVPKFTDDASLTQNFSELLVISPYILGFVFSFIFIAVFWVNHHHLYHVVKEVNSTLLWYNIHFLFWITMLPFAIAMVEDHPHVSLSSISLGIVLFMASVAAFLLLHYSYVKSKLVDQTLSYDSIHNSLIKNKVAVIVTLLGILVALKWVYVSYCIYFVVLIIFIIPQKLEKRKRSLKTNPTTLIDPL